MRKSWITLGALLAGVIALGLFVWLKPPKPQTATHALSSLKSSDARSVRVLRKGKALGTLERHNGEWAMTEPLKAPADNFQVLRLLAILEAKSPLQYPALASAKFELEAPLSEIIINEQRFAFGAINTVTREQYVLTQNQIYPLDAHFGATIPADATALLRRSVLASNDAPSRFEFSTFTVAHDGKKWLTTPPADEHSQDEYNRWVAQWRDGSGLRTQVVADLANARKPISNIHITLKDGAKVALGVVQTEPELILQRTDLGLQFVFTGDVGKQMLSPPGVRK